MPQEIDPALATAELSDALDLVHQSVIGLMDRVEDLTERLANDKTIGVADVAVAMFTFKTQYEAIDKTVKRLYHVTDRLKKGVLPERMADDNMDMLRVPSVARSFSRQTKMSASFLDKAKGFDWLRSIEQDDLIQETVNASTLTAFVKSMIEEEGMDPPEDIVKVNTYNDIGITKYTPKKGDN